MLLSLRDFPFSSGGSTRRRFLLGFLDVEREEVCERVCVRLLDGGCVSDSLSEVAMRRLVPLLVLGLVLREEVCGEVSGPLEPTERDRERDGGAYKKSDTY